MQSAQPLDIKVIYTASDNPRRPRRRMSAVSSPRVAATGGFGGIIVGLMNLAFAGCLAWTIWYQVDPFLYMTTIWKAPIPGVNIEDAAAMLLPGLGPARSSGSVPRIVGPPDPPVEASVKTDAAAPRYTGDRARITIGATMYGWLTVATISCGLVAMAGGVALATKLGSDTKAIRRWMFRLGLLGLVGFAGYAAFQYGKSYPPDLLRMWMCALVFVFALAGLAKDRGARTWCRVAGLGLIFAAMCTIAGLYLFGQCDAIDPKYTTSTFIVGGLVIHSIYGWLLFPIASRVSR